MGSLLIEQFNILELRKYQSNNTTNRFETFGINKIKGTGITEEKNSTVCQHAFLATGFYRRSAARYTSVCAKAAPYIHIIPSNLGHFMKIPKHTSM